MAAESHQPPDPAALAVPALTQCPDCGLPAEVRSRFVVWREPPTPVECAVVRCLSGHHFRCPVELFEHRRRATVYDDGLDRLTPVPTARIEDAPRPQGPA